MANLGNLIVRGVTRILGDAYANKFIGNLQGNADTATSAIKASTADSATSATSANKASIATAVQDYGTSDYREIKIGYSGSGLSSSNIETAIGFTDNGTKIKDISKDEFRNWLATASGTWNISITGNAATATNADTSNRAKFLETFHQNSTTNTWGSQYPIWAQWSDATNVRLKCTNYTVWTDKANYANSAGNADTVDNMHASTLLHLDGYYYIPGNNNNSSTKFWSKIGSITFTAAWQQCGASLTFYEWEARHMMGELKFNIRTSSSKSTASADIVWMNLTNKKFENSFIICRTGDGKYDIYFEYPTISYINIKFYIISQYDNGYITWQNGSALTSTEPTYVNEKFVSSLTSWVGNADYATSAGSVAWSNVTEKPSSYIPAKHNHEKITHILWDYSTAISDTTSPADICARFDVAVNGVHAIFTGIMQNSNGTRYQSLFWTGYGAAGLVELTKSYGGDGRLKYRISSGWSDNGAHWSTVGYKELANVEDLTWANIKSKPETATRWPSWSEITSKPTTISGYGITDAYTKTQIDTKLSRYLTEQNLQGYATQEWVRGEEYLYRSGGTMDARAEIGITTKLFIGNSTSSDTCYTKFNCILHGGGDESNPNWIIRDNGYSEFKSSVSANAFYASSDIRLKNILDDINIDFDKLKLIPKKYYTWKGSDILQLGTIAQDIQKIYPEVVSKNENGYLSVDYSKLSIIALAAIDKLNERIKELECQIKL